MAEDLGFDIGIGGLPFTAALLGTTGPAAANPTAAQLSAIKVNCRSDYISNCWGVPKSAKAFQCLKDHMAKRWSGCQQAVKVTIPPPPPAAAKPETAPPAPAPSTATAKPAAPPTTETPTAAPASEAKAAPAADLSSTPATPPKAASEPPAKHAKAEAPAEPAKALAAAPTETPPIIGFLPPRMKLMVLRNCHHTSRPIAPTCLLARGAISAVFSATRPR